MILETYQHSDDARNDFLDVVKGNNVFSPIHHKTIYINNFAVEITSGEFMGDTLYGVTVVNTLTKSQEYDLSGCCHSEKEIKAKITVLKRVGA